MRFGKLCMVNLLSLLVGVLLSGTMLLAQIALRSSITGVVTDPSGAVVPGAKVTLTDVQRGQTRMTTTNQAGLYTFSDLTFGQYRVTVEHAGFSQSISPVTRVAVGQTVRIDLTLQTGEVRSSVTVSGKPPLLQTEGATVGGLANRNFVENLPSEGRNYTSFAQLAILRNPELHSGDSPRTFWSCLQRSVYRRLLCQLRP